MAAEKKELLVFLVSRDFNPGQAYRCKEGLPLTLTVRTTDNPHREVTVFFVSDSGFLPHTNNSTQNQNETEPRRTKRKKYVLVILAVMVGLSWTTGFVLFSVRIAVFADVFVQAWGMVQVGAEV